MLLDGGNPVSRLVDHLTIQRLLSSIHRLNRLSNHAVHALIRGLGRLQGKGRGGSRLRGGHQEGVATPALVRDDNHIVAATGA